jgi:adenine-specific DNA-methyltransferase
MAGVDDYRHTHVNRLNIPDAGLLQYVDRDEAAVIDMDPRSDPVLQWVKKDPRDLVIPAPTLYTHESLSAMAVMSSIRREPAQPQLFDDPDLDRTQKVQAYEHPVKWRNRLILGDSLQVMGSLLERERMAESVSCIYFDPPYGINFSSNFQRRLSSRVVKESDDYLTREPEQVKAYRDTWTLGVHSYLTYMRHRLIACRELLKEDGSIFVQINDLHLHHVRHLLDEVFGADNFVAIISFKKKKMPLGETFLFTLGDYIVWHTKNKSAASSKFRRLYAAKDEDDAAGFSYVELPSGERLSRADCIKMYGLDALRKGRLFQSMDMRSSGRTESCVFDVDFDGRIFSPRGGKSWKTNAEGMDVLRRENRLFAPGDSLRYVLYLDDYPVSELSNHWLDTQGATDPSYVVQTSTKVVDRCILMTTDPGDLVFDPTCGSGTTAYVCENRGRRWITADTSAVALALARERLLTSTYPYFKLRDPEAGVASGFVYKTAAHLTLGSLTRAEPSEPVPLYDQPEIEPSKVRVSGPFTVEALSRYAVNPLQDDVPPDPQEVTATSDHVNELLDALRQRGLPQKRGESVGIDALTRLSGTSPLHAEGLTADGTPFAVSIGPRYGPITVQQVDEALADAAGFELVVFAGFTATAEVQSFVARGKVGKYSVMLLEANSDLLLGDLLKNTKASQTFRLFAAPDVKVRTAKGGGHVVQLNGVDVFDAGLGEVRQSSTSDIAAWFLDQDYNGEVFHVCQAFFPKSSGWEALAKALKGTLDEDALAKLATFESNPFDAGTYRRIAVRVIDDNGQTSEAVMPLD